MAQGTPQAELWGIEEVAEALLTKRITRIYGYEENGVSARGQISKKPMGTGTVFPEGGISKWRGLGGIKNVLEGRWGKNRRVF